MSYTLGYDMKEDNTYEVRKNEEFLPTTVEFKYDSPSKKFTLWKNRISLAPNLSTSLAYDLLRPTQSYFTFAPKLTLGIHQFLDISFSISSRNNTIYRYFQEYDDKEIVIPGETNLFTDLFNSFALWDQQKREASGFKLKSLTLEVKHDLHDWNLAASLTIEPRTITEGAVRKYDYKPYFTLSVLWRPMQSIKTTVEDKYGTVTLNP
jgi:hypothetical protein